MPFIAHAPAPVQKKPPWQSPSTAHVVWQFAEPALQKYGAHVVCVTAQPPPLHVPVIFHVDVPAAQLAAAHTVPSAYFWQPPAPSHLPFVPQAEAPPSAHIAFGSVVPAASGAHVPALPETLQAWHEPQAALPQQTPSVQWPVPHSWSAPQVAPGIFFAAQLPPAAVQ
jgi:hypothetical protein